MCLWENAFCSFLFTLFRCSFQLLVSGFCKMFFNFIRFKGTKSTRRWILCRCVADRFYLLLRIKSRIMHFLWFREQWLVKVIERIAWRDLWMRDPLVTLSSSVVDIGNLFGGQKCKQIFVAMGIVAKWKQLRSRQLPGRILFLPLERSAFRTEFRTVFGALGAV